MKNWLSKIRIVALATLIGLETCALVNGVPVQSVTSNPVESNLGLTLTRNFPHRHLTQQPQGTVTTTSLPENTGGSENWAGYIVTPSSGDSYTGVSGSWTVPNITADQQNAVAAQWIGLGGVSSNNLLQMGTIEQTENGQLVAEVFWEQLPSTAQYIMTVPIGSTISVNIGESSNSSSTWNLTFTANIPGGQTQTQTIPVTLDSSYAQGIGTSAEWISEDPSNENSQLYPLANMGTVTYNSATVNGQALNSAGNKVQPVAMVSDRGSVIVAPSALGTDGQSFSTSMVSTNTGTGSTSRYGQNRFPGAHKSQVNWSTQGQDGYSWSWSWSW